MLNFMKTFVTSHLLHLNLRREIWALTLFDFSQSDAHIAVVN